MFFIIFYCSLSYSIVLSISCLVVDTASVHLLYLNCEWLSCGPTMCLTLSSICANILPVLLKSKKSLCVSHSLLLPLIFHSGAITELLIRNCISVHAAVNIHSSRFTAISLHAFIALLGIPSAPADLFWRLFYFAVSNLTFPFLEFLDLFFRMNVVILLQ